MTGGGKKLSKMNSRGIKRNKNKLKTSKTFLQSFEIHKVGMVFENIDLHQFSIEHIIARMRIIPCF